MMNDTKKDGMANLDQCNPIACDDCTGKTFVPKPIMLEPLMALIGQNGSLDVDVSQQLKCAYVIGRCLFIKYLTGSYEGFGEAQDVEAIEDRSGFSMGAFEDFINADVLKTQDNVDKCMAEIQRQVQIYDSFPVYSELMGGSCKDEPCKQAYWYNAINADDSLLRFAAMIYGNPVQHFVNDDDEMISEWARGMQSDHFVDNKLQLQERASMLKLARLYVYKNKVYQENGQLLQDSVDDGFDFTTIRGIVGFIEYQAVRAAQDALALDSQSMSK